VILTETGGCLTVNLTFISFSLIKEFLVRKGPQP